MCSFLVEQPCCLGEVDLKAADRRVLRTEFSCTVQLVTGLADKLYP